MLLSFHFLTMYTYNNTNLIYPVLQTQILQFLLLILLLPSSK